MEEGSEQEWRKGASVEGGLSEGCEREREGWTERGRDRAREREEASGRGREQGRE